MIDLRPRPDVRTAPSPRYPSPRHPHRRRHGALVVAVVVLVALVDQVSKAWAWRNSPYAVINSAGNPFSGSTIADLLAGRTSGAVFDIVNASLLLAAGWLLVRFSPTRAVAASGAALLAGWVSNIGDRLGLHYVTAPGSVRGVVDFIPFAGHTWNLADTVIATASAALLLALLAVPGARRPRTRPRPVSAWLPASVAVVLVTVCVLAALGATHGGYLDGPQSVADASWGLR